MVNPFDLPGPEFLAVYAALGAVVIGALYLLRRMAETEEPPRIDFSDPYLIAYLRGGEDEALRVATVSLLDRGFLNRKNGDLATSDTVRADLTRRPIEKTILEKFARRDAAVSIFKTPELKATCSSYKDALRRLRLLPDEAMEKSRAWRLFIALAILSGVALVKIMIALQRGRHNILFLILLAVFLGIAAVKVGNPFRTRRGDALLADLRTLFSSLQARASSLRPGGATGELALLMAVFGLTALPEFALPYATALFPKALSTTSSCSSGCGSTCGSSCGGGGGGGCGGCGGS